MDVYLDLAKTLLDHDGVDYTYEDVCRLAHEMMVEDGEVDLLDALIS